MSAKQQPTRDEHLAMGAEILDLLDRISALSHRVGRAYPYASAAYRGLARAADGLDRTRCDLDSRSTRDMPDDLWSAKIYYGQDRAERAEWIKATTSGGMATEAIGLDQEMLEDDLRLAREVLGDVRVGDPRRTAVERYIAHLEAYQPAEVTG